MSNKDKMPTPNDQRSDQMNPNNPGYKSAQENRSDQMNPNNPRHPSNTPGTGGMNPDTRKKP